MRRIGVFLTLSMALTALSGCGQQQTGRYQITPGGALLDTTNGATYVAVGGSLKQWEMYIKPIQPK